MKQVGVIGAGLSGLTCARILREAGYAVTVFDKGRGVAGRLSTRRVPASDLQFDHGGQYFTARNPDFRQQVEDWCERGVVALWDGPYVSLDKGNTSPPPGNDPRYVGVPGMNAMVKDLARDLDVQVSLRVSGLNPIGNRWELDLEDLATGEMKRWAQPFDHLVLTIPPAQATQLLPEETPLQKQCREAVLDPCRCLMLGFAESLGLPYGAAFVQNNPLRWIACENSKPGRSSALECWVLHANPEWSIEHVDQPHEEIVEPLKIAFAEAIGRDLPEIVHVSSHRWLYAIPRNPYSVGSFHDHDRQLTICGDWCHDARIEGAFMSGFTAARQLLATWS